MDRQAPGSLYGGFVLIRPTHTHRGVFINVQSLPQGAQWLPYISFIKWAFNAFAVNQFEGMTFACEDAGNKVRTHV